MYVFKRLRTMRPRMLTTPPPKLWPVSISLYPGCFLKIHWYQIRNMVILICTYLRASVMWFPASSITRSAHLTIPRWAKPPRKGTWRTCLTLAVQESHLISHQIWNSIFDRACASDCKHQRFCRVVEEQGKPGVHLFVFRCASISWIHNLAWLTEIDFFQ